MFQELQSFLDRFKGFEPPEGTRKKAVIAVIAEVVGVTISPGQIKIQGNMAYIQTNSILRNEIMLHKSDILRKLRGHFGEASRNPVTDIR